ncbi:GNAT family N-acetyltransferase [Streptomyces cinnamoneus]|uniref:Ribosomal-protein-alanine acetyltransferase n=1 Tax=Streptomyces cinnamoneus TaxID=53446 RepID=A0A918TB05_STRCJ|nr:GNAT family protein [Streptomyces cinnamoneus]GHC34021.1 ribosomal-protein-alanine acetyltransferase [Streptomyces cinnamoneus]
MFTAFRSYVIAPGFLLRPATPDDADGLAVAYRRNREHLRPWEPFRDEAFFTTDGQTDRLRNLAELRRTGRAMPWLLVADEGQGDVVGVVNVTNVVQGPLLSATLGYWIAADHTGKGLAPSAVTAVCRDADEHLGLHRIEAGTVTSNTASQRVLTKCGFELIGKAPNYLHIHGAWRDHFLFQKILNDRVPD